MYGLAGANTPATQYVETNFPAHKGTRKILRSVKALASSTHSTKVNFYD